MPKVLIVNNWIFVFYATDSNENRAHVHVGKKDMLILCKIWIEPNIELAKSGELTNKQLNEVMTIADNHKLKLMQQWKRFIKGEKVATIKII
jgi:hypothetical protein